MRLRILAAALLLSVSTLAAKADSFSYVYNDPTVFKASFTYVSPFLITTDTKFTPTTCIVVGQACTSVEIDPVNTSISEFLGNGNSYSIAGFPASFFTVGTHSVQGITLSITQIATATTPEPSSLALLGTGVLGVIGAVRRRLA